MAKIPRKSQKRFGTNASSNEIAQFGSLAASSPVRYSGSAADPDNIQALSNWLAGMFGATLGDNSPAEEDVNAAFFVAFYQLAYLLQTGVPEWDTGTTYYKGSVVSGGGANVKLYTSLTDTNLGNALSDGTNWAAITSNSQIAVSSPYQILAGDNLMLGSGNTTLTLPSATTVAGRKYTIKKTDSNVTALTLATLAGATIDGAASYTLAEQYQFVTVCSDGANWWIVAAG